MVFISASNELGAFESARSRRASARCTTVVAGGIATIGIALASIKLFPDLARMGKLEDLGPSRPVSSRKMSVDRRSVWPYVDGEPGEFMYSRYAHPTGRRGRARARRARGRAGAALLLGLGGDAGAAARADGAGRHVALAEGCYFGTGVMMREELGALGPRDVEFDQTGPPPAGADLVWLEAPSNPFLTMPDLDAAAAHPGRVVVDSTAATPVFLRPLEHGADFALHSATKYLTGHSDALAGAIVCRDQADYDRLWQFRQRTGPNCARRRRRARHPRAEDTARARRAPDRDRAHPRRSG